MKQKNIGKYMGIVFIISVSLGVLIHFEKFANIFNLNERIPDFGYKPHNILETFSDIFVSSMVAFFSFIINYFVIKPFESQQKTDFKRIAFAVIITIATIIILSDLLFSLKKNLTTDGNLQNFMFLYFFRDILISAIVIVSVFFIKAINDRQAIKIENEKLKNENLISQYETLKKQVSPHFFFNSLTSLKELISQNPEKAEDYINHLSLVMRYTLQNNESKTKSLKDELFVNDSYLFLVKIRFENNLHVIQKTASEFEYYRLPALAVQTLIENAIKHNEISKRKPLTVRIETTNNSSLKVTNNLQERSTPEQSNGTGLSNLSRQYKFLSGKDISISKTELEFCVELPLLKPE